MQGGCVATLIDVCSNFAVFVHHGKVESIMKYQMNDVYL